MSFSDRVWTPSAVHALQAAYRSVYPAITDEQFAQEVLGVATRTLYLWRSRPLTRIRPGTQRALNHTLDSAPDAVVERFRQLPGSPATPSVVQGSSLLHSPTSFTDDLDITLSTLGALADGSGSTTHYRPDALAATVLDWLASVANRESPVVGQRVSQSDVEQIRTTAAALDTIERRIGGAGCRDAATSYLRGTALPLLSQSVNDGIRTGLFSAVAELCELVGWMFYDAGQHGVAQGYFTQALRLSREADDDALSAYLMTSMTDQALRLGELDQALRIAKTARHVAESADSPHVLVEAELFTARAHAALSDVSDATAALQRAERAYALTGTTGARTWAPQWDAVMFASHVGTCWNTLGNTNEARRWMTQVKDASADRPRRLMYSSTELGLAALNTGELDEACQHAQDALALKAGVDSGRANQHFGTLTQGLRNFSSSRVVREFFDTHDLISPSEGATR